MSFADKVRRELTTVNTPVPGLEEHTLEHHASFGAPPEDLLQFQQQNAGLVPSPSGAGTILPSQHGDHDVGSDTLSFEGDGGSSPFEGEGRKNGPSTGGPSSGDPDGSGGPPGVEAREQSGGTAFGVSALPSSSTERSADLSPLHAETTKPADLSPLHAETTKPGALLPSSLFGQRPVRADRRGAAQGSSSQPSSSKKSGETSKAGSSQTLSRSTQHSTASAVTADGGGERRSTANMLGAPAGPPTTGAVHPTPEDGGEKSPTTITLGMWPAKRTIPPRRSAEQAVPRVVVPGLAQTDPRRGSPSPTSVGRTSSEKAVEEVDHPRTSKHDAGSSAATSLGKTSEKSAGVVPQDGASEREEEGRTTHTTTTPCGGTPTTTPSGTTPAETPPAGGTPGGTPRADKWSTHPPEGSEKLGFYMVKPAFEARRERSRAEDWSALGEKRKAPREKKEKSIPSFGGGPRGLDLSLGDESSPRTFGSPFGAGSAKDLNGSFGDGEAVFGDTFEPQRHGAVVSGSGTSATVGQRRKRDGSSPLEAKERFGTSQDGRSSDDEGFSSSGPRSKEGFGPQTDHVHQPPPPVHRSVSPPPAPRAEDSRRAADDSPLLKSVSEPCSELSGTTSTTTARHSAGTPVLGASRYSNHGGVPVSEEVLFHSAPPRGWGSSTSGYGGGPPGRVSGKGGHFGLVIESYPLEGEVVPEPPLKSSNAGDVVPTRLPAGTVPHRGTSRDHQSEAPPSPSGEDNLDGPGKITHPASQHALSPTALAQALLRRNSPVPVSRSSRMSSFSAVSESQSHAQHASRRSDFSVQQHSSFASSYGGGTTAHDSYNRGAGDYSGGAGGSRPSLLSSPVFPSRDRDRWQEQDQPVSGRSTLQESLHAPFGVRERRPSDTATTLTLGFAVQSGKRSKNVVMGTEPPKEQLTSPPPPRGNGSAPPGAGLPERLGYYPSEDAIPRSRSTGAAAIHASYLQADSPDSSEQTKKTSGELVRASGQQENPPVMGFKVLEEDLDSKNPKNQMAREASFGEIPDSPLEYSYSTGKGKGAASQGTPPRGSSLRAQQSFGQHVQPTTAGAYSQTAANRISSPPGGGPRVPQNQRELFRRQPSGQQSTGSGTAGAGGRGPWPPESIEWSSPNPSLFTGRSWTTDPGLDTVSLLSGGGPHQPERDIPDEIRASLNPFAGSSTLSSVSSSSGGAGSNRSGTRATGTTSMPSVPSEGGSRSNRGSVASGFSGASPLIGFGSTPGSGPASAPGSAVFTPLSSTSMPGGVPAPMFLSDNSSRRSEVPAPMFLSDASSSNFGSKNPFASSRNTSASSARGTPAYAFKAPASPTPPSVEYSYKGRGSVAESEFLLRGLSSQKDDIARKNLASGDGVGKGFAMEKGDKAVAGGGNKDPGKGMSASARGSEAALPLQAVPFPRGAAPSSKAAAPIAGTVPSRGMAAQQRVGGASASSGTTSRAGTAPSRGTAPQAAQQRVASSSNPSSSREKKPRSLNQFDFIRKAEQDLKTRAPNWKAEAAKRQITIEEVKKHKSRHDAWMVLDGNVYDVTSYLPYHPGGKGELLRGVGMDATELYNEVHPWVAYDTILQSEFIGKLVPSGSPSFGSTLQVPGGQRQGQRQLSGGVLARQLEGSSSSQRRGQGVKEEPRKSGGSSGKQVPREYLEAPEG